MINAHKDYEQRKSHVLSSFMVHQFLSIIWWVLFKYRLGIIRKFSSGATCTSEVEKLPICLASLKKIDQMIYEVIKKEEKWSLH